MPTNPCPTCGQPMQGDDCPRCRAATAFAKPEDAEQAKVTPPAASDGAIREGEPPAFPKPPEPWPYKHEPGPWLSLSSLSCFVVGLLGVGAFLAFIVPACLQVRYAQTRSATYMNMKQIGLAIHSYHDIHKRLPTPNMVVQKDGKDQALLLSWRVAILPHLEQEAVHNAFDLNVAWDHQKNAPLQSKMPSIYTCPYRDNPEPARLTFIQYFTGPATLFPDNATRKLQEIPDGSSNTLLFADSDHVVIWSSPADMAIRPDQPLPLPADRFMAVMGDGSVRTFWRNTTSDTILRQLINPNDQKPDAGWDN